MQSYITDIYFVQNKKRFQIIALVIMEIFLGIMVLLLPHYTIPICIFLLILLIIFLYPEVGFILMILTISQILYLKIDYPYSMPPRTIRMFPVPIDSVILPQFVSYIILFITLVAWLFARMAKLKASYKATSLELPLALLFLWSMTTLIWSPDVDTGLIEIFMLASCYLVFFLTISIIDSKDILATVLKAFMFIGLLNAFLVVLSLYQEPISKQLFQIENIKISFNIFTASPERGTGIAGPNYTAYFSNICTFFTAGLLLVTNDIKKKIIIFHIILTMLFANFLTFSKGGFVGLCSGILFIGIMHKPFRKHLVIYVTILIFIFLLLNIIKINTWPWPQRGQLLSGAERPSLFPRKILWASGFNGLIESNGLGFGCGRFFPAHSLYFFVLFDLGIPGLMIWFWLMFRVYYSIGSIIKKPQNTFYGKILICTSAAMIAISMHGLVDYLHIELVLWIVLGVNMAIISCIKNNYDDNYKKAII